MYIFLCHSSRDKPLIREIVRYLPSHIQPWIDERDIHVGEPLDRSIQKAIAIKTDFVVIFIGPEAVRSAWVKRELEWALARERKIGRVFVLPVLLDKESWNQLPEEFQNRRYLPCTDLSETGVRHFSQKLSDEIFALVSEQLKRPDSLMSTLKREDETRRRERVKKLAAQIADDQSDADEGSCLSRKRLEFIVSSLDPKAKVQLLALYEMDRGRFRERTAKQDLTKARLLKIDFQLPHIGIWTDTLDWECEAFVSLQQDYGLGDDRHLVRAVFLDGIGNLTELKRRELFSGIEITGCNLLL
jgi:hypothetical protein